MVLMAHPFLRFWIVWKDWGAPAMGQGTQPVYANRGASGRASSMLVEFTINQKMAGRDQPIAGDLAKWGLGEKCFLA
jgi:hypothetical protein